MFLYPLSRMVGGIFYEHAHRLFGSLVGLTTLTLTVWILLAERRGWLKIVAVAALVLVIVQGVMGGLRVTGHFTWSDSPEVTRPSLTLAMIHGVTGQLFFALMLAIAAFLSRGWRSGARVPNPSGSTDHTLSLALAIGLVVQLTLGVRLRHLGEGLFVHMTVAVLLLGLGIAVGARGLGLYREIAPVRGASGALLGHLGLQVVLGGAAFAVVGTEPSTGSPGTWEVIIATAHQDARSDGARELRAPRALAAPARRARPPGRRSPPPRGRRERAPERSFARRGWGAPSGVARPSREWIWSSVRERSSRCSVRTEEARPPSSGSSRRFSPRMPGEPPSPATTSWTPPARCGAPSAWCSSLRASTGELSVRENLVHQGRLQGLRGARLTTRIDQALDALGVLDRAGDRVRELSGGLARRADVAKALLHSPPLLLLDEPSTGLDPGARADLMRCLKEARDRTGTTCFLTTHLMEEAEGCDRVGILDQGELVALGPPDELKSEIGGQVVTLTGRPTRRGWPARWSTFSGGSRSWRTGKLRMETDRGADLVPEILSAFPGRVTSATIASPSLADVFFHRTGRSFRAEGESA